MELSQRRVVDAAELGAGDELADLRAISPPPDLAATALSTVSAVMVFPLLAGAAALALHPLSFTPAFLVPALGVPALASLVLSRFRAQGVAAGAALAVASAASTLFYLGLFAVLLAVARVAGAVVLG